MKSSWIIALMVTFLAIAPAVVRANSIDPLTGINGSVTLGTTNTLAADGTLKFDDLGNAVAPIPNGYGGPGLNWNNFYSIDGVNNSPSGYTNGVVSPENVAFNGNGNAASFSTWAISCTPLCPQITFNSAYFTAAWNDGLQLNIQGLLNNVLVPGDVATLTIDTSGPNSKYLFAPNWNGIDTVLFQSSGGVPDPALASSGAGEQFAMDNATITGIGTTSVPEPGSLVLLGTGLASMVGFLRRRLG